MSLLTSATVASIDCDMNSETNITATGNPAHPAKEVAMLVKFSTLADGVFIEDNGTDERKPSDRCFRFDANGNAEYALFADLTGSNPAPRWFGHQFRERDFTFA